MSVASMTGFARAAGSDASGSWAWELKSVNGRSLEVRLRLPPGFDRLELPVRARFQKAFQRGNLNASLNFEPAKSAPKLQINREVLAQLVALTRELESQVEAAPARLDGLLAMRGVIELGEGAVLDDEALAARDAAVLATLDQSIAALQAMRTHEGSAVLAALRGHLDEVDDLARAARDNPATSAPAIKARLEAQFAELLGGAIAADRLAQEAAMLAMRADIREEIDRLSAHVGQSREMLATGGAIGRKLDFLAQELNREANTLCSKSNDLELTRTGLALKAAIDRFREQAANVE